MAGAETADGDAAKARERKMEKQKAMEASDARQMLRLVSCFVIANFIP